MAPVQEKKYDLVVIGTGDAGKTAAHAAAREGWKVAIIEKNRVGGTCALWGCVPKKILISGAEFADFSRRMMEAGVADAPGTVSWQGLMKFKEQLTGSYSEEDEKDLAERGIDLYPGKATFVDRSAVQAGNDTLRGRYILIGSGACPRPLEIEGEQYITSSAEFLYLKSLPRRILFIGGGYISFEFAHLAVRCGSEVTILNRSDGVLKKFDPDLAGRLMKASENVGITIALMERPKKIIKGKQCLTVIVESRGEDKTYSADMVVHGAGRTPDIDDLNLGAAGIRRSREGILVNAYMQSISNNHVYAAGDAAAGGPLLTPVAMREGRIAADNLLRNMQRKRPKYDFVPSVVFSLPRLASVGMHEADAKKRGIHVLVKEKDTSKWLHNQRVNEQYAGSKVIIENDTGKILGAHILDSHADDLINVFALAMENGLTAEQLRKTLYAYPTATSSIQYMVE